MADLMAAGCHSGYLLGARLLESSADVASFTTCMLKNLDATFSLRCFSTEVNAFPGSADDIARALGWVK